jgi:glycosyltransferase involved in cell wall biosynthesis
VVAAGEGSGDPYINKLLPSLLKMGCEVRFAGWDRFKRLPSQIESGGILFNMIFRGWGYANKWLALAYPLWMLRVCVYLLRQRPDVIYAIDLGAGLPAAGITFIYDIRDNFSMRTTTPSVVRPLIAWLDKWVVHRAQKVIVADECRIAMDDPLAKARFVVIYNCALDLAPKEPHILPQDHPFTVYAMGYLLKTRGIDLLLAAAGRLPRIRFLLAGFVIEEELKELIKSTPNVDFRGFLSQEDALRLCFESDIVFTFYDPVSEINRRAASNKWSDAMMASRPILINSEVLRSAWVQREDIGYVCPYGDVDELVKILDHVRQQPEEAQRKGANGRRLYEAGYNWSAMEQRSWQVLSGLGSRVGK